MKPSMKQVEEVHQACAEINAGLSLRLTFAVGHKWPASKSQAAYANGSLRRVADFMVVWDYESGENKLSDFGLYNSIEIQNLRKRSDFLKRANKVKWMRDILDSQHVTPKQLAKLTLECYQYSSCLFPWKMYALAHFSEEELKEFNGLQPITTPVKESLWNLFGEKQGPIDHVMFCKGIADEIGESITYVNTVLYSLGL